MGIKPEMKIRLDERMRLYRDSPNLTATYIDLVRIIEDIIEISGKDSSIGFNSNISSTKDLRE